MTALMMTLAIAPGTFAADEMRDVSFKITFRNDGGAPVLIYPGAAKLCAHVSIAGAGICWEVRFDSKVGAAADVREIRTWYGPPGEPPLATAIKKQTEVRLAPGQEKTAELRACWIPNALLPPPSLTPAVLDPEGMDGIDAPAGGARPGAPPPLKETFPLARASALLFGADCATMKKAMRERPDFLRGHVVALFEGPGDWQARVAFLQQPWLFEAAHLVAMAEPLPIRIAYPDHKSTR